jgi:hypothetical protein
MLPSNSVCLATLQLFVPQQFSGHPEVSQNCSSHTIQLQNKHKNCSCITMAAEENQVLNFKHFQINIAFSNSY